MGRVLPWEVLQEAGGVARSAQPGQPHNPEHLREGIAIAVGISRRWGQAEGQREAREEWRRRQGPARGAAWRGRSR
jgi:hypothetical protein